jgi:hypothetical protein
MPDIRINTYDDNKLDELAGGLLYAGGLQSALSHVLDITQVKGDYKLVGYVDHMPVEPASAIVTALHAATSEVVVRLTAIRAELNLIAKALVERVRAERKQQEADKEFSNLVVGSFGDQAKKDGLS